MTAYRILSDEELEKLIIRHAMGDLPTSEEVANLIATVKRERRGRKLFEEVIDDVRESLGQEETHYLVVADDVLELVKAVELCASDGGCRAMTVLKKLRNGYK